MYNKEIIIGVTIPPRDILERIKDTIKSTPVLSAEIKKFNNNKNQKYLLVVSNAFLMVAKVSIFRN
ncbi:MAG: hypothetical protein QXD62_02160 [Candidatus Woesearchaeota archaeon]